MPWAKHDDRWDDCEQFNGASADAVALYFRATSRMARLTTDGVLTVRDLAILDQSRSEAERERVPYRAIMEELAARGVLVVERDHWLDPGWLERNPSRAELEAQRAYDAIRQRIRYARANGADEARLAELKADEGEARRQLYAIRDARQAAALSQREAHARSHSVREVSQREAEHESHNAPSRPRPVPIQDEDEDEGATGGTGPLSLLQTARDAIERHESGEQPLDPVTEARMRRTVERSETVEGRYLRSIGEGDS